MLRISSRLHVFFFSAFGFFAAFFFGFSSESSPTMSSGLGSRSLLFFFNSSAGHLQTLRRTYGVVLGHAGAIHHGSVLRFQNLQLSVYRLTRRTSATRNVFIVGGVENGRLVLVRIIVRQSHIAALKVGILFAFLHTHVFRGKSGIALCTVDILFCSRTLLHDFSLLLCDFCIICFYTE